jgi:D-serine deaminase-like pyridoxal phosphate-dependent protein
MAATAWQLARYKLPTALEQRLCSPSLVIYADVLRQNVERVIKACGGAQRWQPHIKTVKSKAIIEELINSGVKQFKCATSREAELLGQTLRGRRDGPFEVVVSYPHTGPTLARIAAAARACRYGDGDAEEDIVSWAVIVEDVAGAREVVEAGRTRDPLLNIGSFDEDRPVALDVYLDINPGMNRTGCPLENALETARAIRAEVGERFSGLHMYDGHAGGLLKEHAGDRRKLDAALFPLYDKLLEIDAALGATCTLITAGTPALLSSVAHAGLAATGRHRVSAGTIVLGDLRSFDECPVGLEPAAVVVSRCVSNPTEGVYTLDAGVKALAADAGDPLCQIIGKADYTLRKASEEHLPVECDSIAKGDVLYLVPKHICPTVNLAETALWIEDGGENVACHRVNVHARAHPLLANDRPIDVEMLDGSFFCNNTTDIFPRDSDGTSSRKRRRG